MLPQMQFLDLPQIDAAIQNQKAAELKNALAPYMMQKAQMEAEKGGLEMQLYRDKIDREKRIRDSIQRLATGEGQASAPAQAQDAPPASSMPGGEGSPKVGGPDWMQAFEAQKPPAAPAQSQPSGGKQAMVQRFLKQAEVYAINGDPDTANKLYEHAAKFMPEVSKIEVAMDSGKPVNVIYFKDGSQQVAQYAPTPKVHWTDNGQRIQGFNEYDMNPVGAPIQKQQTLDSIAGNQVAIRGQNLTDARGKEANDLKRQEIAGGGKPPAGYRWKNDGSGALESIPGGPGDKLPEAQQKQVIGVQNLQNAIADYRKELDGFGGIDGLNPSARATMGTKYNNMMLQAKEAYNLGVLNGPDYDILTAVITNPMSFKGALTPKAALDKQASELDRIAGGIGQVASNPRPQIKAGQTPTSAPAAKPKTGESVDGYMFLGGDPADSARWKKVNK